MPIRIYALAKDLKIDSKDLVDLCTKAGIQGKGSALASLEDDEIVKLKAFMDGGGTAAKRPAAGAAPIVDTKAVLSSPVTGTVTLPPPPPPPPRPSPLRRPAPVGVSTAPAVAAPAAGGVALAPPPPKEKEAEPEESPPVVSARVAEPPPPPAPTAPSPPPARVGRATSTAAPPSDMSPVRGDPLARRGTGMKVLDTQTKRGVVRKKDDATAKPPERRTPGMRFAAMPEVKQPTPSERDAGPKTQKPLIRLPSDVLKGKGPKSAPLSEVTKRLEKERTQSQTGQKGKPGVGTGGPLTGKPARGGKRGRPGEEGEAGLGDMASVRADRQNKRKKGKVGGRDEDEGPVRRRRNLTRIKSHGSTAAPRKGKIALTLPCTVRSFSEATGVGSGQILKSLMGMGMMVTINAPIPDDFVEALVAELGLELDYKAAESLEEQMLAGFEDEEDPATLVPRPPIVTFLGHVDHGKTSLLDKLIGINVVSGEAGGITQHIRAYSIQTKDGRRVSFVDTPGHEAFTEMRARGANVTDIAVLVVAADDGIMPQTEEAISHAKAAQVPIVVAMNKIDLPSADEQKVLQQLATANLLPSEWGGEVEVIRTSATTGKGMDNLLETLLVTAELHELKGNPDRPAVGTCLEAEQEAGRGVIAKVMVQNGTLREGDVIVCGGAHGRVKAMFDTLRPRQKVKEAGPSTPVNITGLDLVPAAGDKFYVLDDVAKARELALQRQDTSRTESLSGGGSTKVSFDEFQKRLEEGKLGQDEEVSILNLIIRADVRGSIEAIQKELGKFEHPEVKVKVLQASVGGISVADVTLAQASGAVVVGFNVIPDEAARALADDRRVEIRRYDIIYKLTDDIKLMLEGKLKPEERVVEMGRALVKQVFTISRVGAVAGCQVIQGSIERGCRIRLNRDSRTIGDYPMESLRRDKDDVKEVARGMECGIKLAGYNDVKEGDLLEAYKIEEVARTL